ncbi:hypothetical protein [Nannocystis exedens]|uniref:hypothetical protein n=1 Tax=Nannocystis exedens TaxID=54 RepID=UPI0011605C0D|nr:hypothetical protein [Nannocystis exedens]
MSTTPRAGELAQLARVVLDEAVVGVPAWGEDERFQGLVPLPILRYTSPLLQIAPDDPKTTLALLEAMDSYERDQLPRHVPPQSRRETDERIELLGRPARERAHPVAAVERVLTAQLAAEVAIGPQADRVLLQAASQFYRWIIRS